MNHTLPTYVEIQVVLMLKQTGKIHKNIMTTLHKNRRVRCIIVLYSRDVVYLLFLLLLLLLFLYN
jgi:hypothetical protein